MYMSKQAPMVDWAPKTWHIMAKGLYAQMLRDAAVIEDMSEAKARAETNTTATKPRQGDGLFRFRRSAAVSALALTASTSTHEVNVPQPSDARECPIEAEQLDVVTDEMERWKTIDKFTIDAATDEDGLVNEMVLLYKLRSKFPLHYRVFRQVSSHICHEANTERLFSLAGALSDDNGKMSPDTLAVS